MHTEKFLVSSPDPNQFHLGVGRSPDSSGSGFQHPSRRIASAGRPTSPSNASPQDRADTGRRDGRRDDDAQGPVLAAGTPVTQLSAGLHRKERCRTRCAFAHFSSEGWVASYEQHTLPDLESRGRLPGAETLNPECFVGMGANPANPTKTLGFQAQPPEIAFPVVELSGWTVGRRRVAGRAQNPTGGVQRQAPGLLPAAFRKFPVGFSAAHAPRRWPPNLPRASRPSP